MNAIDAMDAKDAIDSMDAIDDQNSRFEDLACWQKKLTEARAARREDAGAVDLS